MAALIQLDPVPASVAAARHFVTDRLLESNAERFLDPTVLLVSEVVTNAIFHGKAPIVCRVTTDDQRKVRVEVQDGSPEPPVVLDPAAMDTTGRGLVLVDVLASAWGSDILPDEGKVVWFEVERGDPSRPEGASRRG